MRFSLIIPSHNKDIADRHVLSSASRVHGQLEVHLVDSGPTGLNVPAALNEGARRSTADILIFCHHDVEFGEDWLSRIEQQLALLDRLDPKWAFAGVFGVSPTGQFVGAIDDPTLKGVYGSLPTVVQSLDEVCLICRRNFFDPFDEALLSHHFFGTDACIRALCAGRKCYAINSPLRHISRGKRDHEFALTLTRLRSKWRRNRAAPTVVETTCGVFDLKPGILGSINSMLVRMRRKFRSRIHDLSNGRFR